MLLNGKWKLFYYQSGEFEIKNLSDLTNKNVPCIEAEVPGNVELDLCRVGLLPEDLFKGENIVEAEKYELYDWWYCRKFNPEKPADDEEVILNFEGVDCIADYYINGKKIGSSDNMFIAHEFNVTDILNYGEDNLLAVHIKSSTVEEARMKTDLNTAFFDWHLKTKSVYMRKPPHVYGWDIMPRAESAGIWRDVELKYLKKVRFNQVFMTPLYFYYDKNKVVYKLCVDAFIPEKYLSSRMQLSIHGVCGDSEFSASEPLLFNSGSYNVTIENPKFWWPVPYGEANLYDCKVTLSIDGTVLCEQDIRIGIREVKLIRTDSTTDKKEGAFHFEINGKKVFCIGSNWVPLDPYHSRDKAKYQRALALAKDVGCNILRCWGGNVYEDHEFFDFCDENGIMVWQDFGMACHIYPQDSDFAKKMETEVEAVVRKLRQHPSIVLWSGDNECDQVWAGKGISPNKHNKITRDVIPSTIIRNDYYRPYIPSSPYITDEVMSKGIEYLPEDHLWGPRDYYKSDFYRNSLAHFVSETGYHGCPSRESIEKFIDKEYVWPYNNRQWNFHSTDQNNSNYRTILMANQIQVLFGKIPSDLDEFVIESQISQAEANKYFIEKMRSDIKRNGGIIWWNLLDGWPQMSDAVVDYYFEKKLSYHYIKRSSKPFILLCNDDGDVVTSNISFESKQGHYTVVDIESGKTLSEGDFNTAPNSNEKLAKLTFDEGEKGMVLLKWTVDGKVGTNIYLYGKPTYEPEKYKEWIKKSGTM